MKYFKESEKEEKLLSEYLKDGSKSYRWSEDARIARTKYLMDILGDVPFSQELYETFIGEFQCWGGRYDVRTKKETIKGIYEISRKYPFLTEDGIEHIWFKYIRDLFEEYSIMDVFEKYVEMFGKTDEAFELFMDYIDKKADIHQERYEQDAKLADELVSSYGQSFVDHIKGLIKREHFTYDYLKEYLPSSELIKKDEKHIHELSRKTRIYFGCCLPVSYTMFDILIEDGTLDTYTDTPTYYINSSIKEQATFTKKEFLDSIKKDRIKSLKDSE